MVSKDIVSSKSRLIALIVNYIPGIVVPTLIGLLSTAIFTRIFNADEYGKFSLAFSIATLVAAMSSQWIQQAVNKFIPATTNTSELSCHKMTIAGSIVYESFLLIFLFIIIYPFLADSVSSVWLPLVAPAAIFAFALFVVNVLLSTLQAQMKAKRYSFFNFMNATLRFILSLAIVFLLYRNVNGLLWGGSVGLLLMLPFMWRAAELPGIMDVFHAHRTHFWEGLRKYAIYGLPMTGWYLAANVLSVSDRYIIQWFRTSSEVGIYAANYNLITGAVALVSMPITLAVHPFLMEAWGGGDKDKSGRWLAIIIELYSIGGFLLVGSVWLFHRDLALLLLGAEFRSGSVILPIVIAGVVVWQMSTYAHKPLEFTGKSKQMMTICAFSALVNIILNLIFVPLYGFVAAAYTTLVSYILYTFIVSYISKKILIWKINWTKVAYNYCIIALGLLLINAVRSYLPEQSNIMIRLAPTIVMMLSLVLIVLKLNVATIKLK